jgi:hypothetical protein
LEKGLWRIGPRVDPPRTGKRRRQVSQANFFDLDWVLINKRELKDQNLLFYNLSAGLFLYFKIILEKI